MRKRLFIGVGGAAAVVLAGAACVGAASATGAATSREPIARSAVVNQGPGLDDAIQACNQVFLSKAAVTGEESFAELRSSAERAAVASDRWATLDMDANVFADAYLAVFAADWRTDVTALGDAREAFAADCSSIGVSTDDD